MTSFMPGDESKLVKAQIAATEGSYKDPIEVYFNPKELTLDKPVKWSPHKGSKDDSPTLEFTQGEAMTMTVELLFDMFEVKGDVYAEYVSKLEKLVFIDSALKRPPLCTFTWGSKMPVFRGVIEDMNVKYTLFLPDGTPTRCTATLKWKQSNSLLLKDDGKKTPSSAGKRGGSPTGA